jgi:arginine decarboxylase
MNTNNTAGSPTTAPLSRHRSVWEVRTESWIELVDELSQLANPAREQGDLEARRAHLHELTEVLKPIEVCWAYPGRRAFTELCGYIARGELAHAAIVARRSHRMLASLTYRHGSPTATSDTELPTQMETEKEYQTQMRCPYFEVLVVDDLPPEEEDSLRRKVRSRRRPDDDFIYDVVVVPTFEDAWLRRW